MNKLVMAKSNEFLYNMRRVEKLSGIADFCESLKKEFDIYHITVELNRVSISLKFDDKEELVPLFQRIASFGQDLDEDPWEYEGDNSINYSCGKVYVVAHPNEGSDCELIQIGTEIKPEEVVPVYKMKCKHLHEMREKEAQEVLG